MTIEKLTAIRKSDNVKGSVSVINWEKEKAKVAFQDGSEYYADFNDIVLSDMALPDQEELAATGMVKLTVDQARNLARTKFNILEEMVMGIANKTLNGLLIQGAGGIGKTEIVKRTLQQMASKGEIDFHFYNSHITPLTMFNTLLRHQSRQSVTVFDDCDDVLHNSGAVDILKAAMDTGSGPREVQYNSTTSLADAQKFFYEGNVIIITNKPIPKDKSTRAFLDRIHHFELQMTREERVVRITDLAQTMGLAKDMKDTDIDICSEWLLQNASRAKEDEDISLRALIKVFDLYKMSPRTWKTLADITIFGSSVTT